MDVNIKEFLSAVEGVSVIGSLSAPCQRGKRFLTILKGRVVFHDTF